MQTLFFFIACSFSVTASRSLLIKNIDGSRLHNHITAMSLSTILCDILYNDNIYKCEPVRKWDYDQISSIEIAQVECEMNVVGATISILAKYMIYEYDIYIRFRLNIYTINNIIILMSIIIVPSDTNVVDEPAIDVTIITIRYGVVCVSFVQNSSRI